MAVPCDHHHYPAQVFTDEEEDELDTTAAQHAAGKDPQGIPWDRLNFTRQQYRVGGRCTPCAGKSSWPARGRRMQSRSW
jgi:hypothetical protein